MDQSLVNAALDVIQRVGVGAAVAFWFMWRSDRRMDELTREVHELVVSLKILLDRGHQ